MGIPQTFTPGRRRSFSHHAECWYAESLDGMGLGFDDLTPRVRGE